MQLPSTFSHHNKQHINVVVETPRYSRNKYTYQPGSGLFKLSKILPAGTAFPYDFGFIPGTLADDGDPLDAMVIIETSCYPGCIMECRVIGAFTAEQKEKGKKKQRNDRVLVIPTASIEYASLPSINKLNKKTVSELIAFFTYYTKMTGKDFVITGTLGPQMAMKIVKEAAIY